MGRRELMERVAPAGDVYQAGTLSGNPLAVAAGLATLRELDAGAYDASASSPTGSPPVCGTRPATGRSGRSAPGLLTPFFSGEPVRDFAGASACDLDATGASAARCSIAGSIRPPSQFEAWFVSLAHDEAAIDRTAEAAAEAFAEALE